jgi:hypothetical protein
MWVKAAWDPPIGNTAFPNEGTRTFSSQGRSSTSPQAKQMRHDESVAYPEDSIIGASQNNIPGEPVY